MKLSVLAISCGLSAVLACNAHRYEVVQRAPRSPIDTSHEIVIEPPRAGDLWVNGEPEETFVAGLDPGGRDAWINLLVVTRQAMNDGLLAGGSGLRPGRLGRAPVAELALLGIDLAMQSPRTAPRTKLRAVLRLRTAEGALADEVNLSANVDAEAVSQDMLDATRARRLRRAGRDIGEQAAAYLRERAGL